MEKSKRFFNSLNILFFKWFQQGNICTMSKMSILHLSSLKYKIWCHELNNYNDYPLKNPNNILLSTYGSFLNFKIKKIILYLLNLWTSISLNSTPCSNEIWFAYYSIWPLLTLKCKLGWGSIGSLKSLSLIFFHNRLHVQNNTFKNEIWLL